MTSSAPSASGQPSSSGAATSAWGQRLAVQLQLLSEVTEQLTYRLLELEERVGVSERSLTALQDESQEGADQQPVMESWLEETEVRLGRVEELLRGRDGLGDTPGTARLLQAVGRPQHPATSADAEMAHVDDESQEQAFPEEEQYFLDEQQIA